MPIINGTAASETLVGGAGNDIITGFGGNDVVRMGGGDDLFVWNPGDGSDKVEGQAGFDILRFTGTAIAENISVNANGTRAQVLSNIGGSTTTDLNGVERILLRALGGADFIQVGDLSATGVQQVVIDLAGTVGGAAGDGVQDLIRRYGTAGNDSINVALIGGNISVTGLSAQMIVTHADATDSVTIFSGAGNDIVNASTLAAGAIGIGMGGDDGNDRLTGSQGNDFLSGDNGNDTVIGGAGDDLVFLGAGNDLSIWNAGHGSDIVEGQGGFDTLRLTGSSASESILITRNGGRVLFLRNIGGVVVDIDDVERLQVNALGGEDRIAVGDLSGTDVREVAIDLAATAGGLAADKKLDVVTVAGSFSNDVIDVTWSGGKIVATDLAAAVSIAHADATDVIAISGGDGDDMLVAGSLLAGKMSLQLVGGLGDDTIFGSAGADAVRGGDGNDLALLGAGNDLFFWSAGDGGDTIEGQDGFDTLQFKGDDFAEFMGVSALAGHAHVTRDLGLVDMDLDDVERVRIQALAGADDITVYDLSGTDVKQVEIDLAGKLPSASDKETDVIVVAGTIGNDQLTLAAPGGVLTITGLPAQVTVAHADAFDYVTIVTGNGNDSVSAVALPPGMVRLALEGGDGKDTFTGGAGDENLFGGGDSDTLRGGGGDDTLSGNDDKDRLEGGAGDDFLYGDQGDDVLLGGLGNDNLIGSLGNDTINGGAGSDTVRYNHPLDGHDVVLGFDGNPAGGQDVLDLDQLLDFIGVLTADRVGRVSIVDKGATVDVFVDADGIGANGFELAVATLHTTDIITKGITGADVIVGNG